MFKFVHAADLHLDTPFSGLGEVSPAVAAELRDASLGAFDRLVDLTIREDAAFLLLAGDIYDGPDRGMRAQLRFYRGLERLGRAGIEAFVVHGNHDPLAGWSAVGGVRDWPEGVHVFGADAVASRQVLRDGRLLAVVHGISYPRRDVSENLALRFARTADPALHVGLLHCNAGGNPDHYPYSPTSVEALAARGMDYWALGHVHRGAVLREADPCIVYPGNLQGRSPKPSECGPKGAYVVESDGGRISALRFEPLDVVRFERVSIDVGELADLPAVSDALHEAAGNLREAAGLRGVVVRAALTGTTPLHALLADRRARAELLRDLRERSDTSAPFVWWDDVHLATRPPGLDRETLRQSPDFRGELLREAERLSADPEALAAFLADATAPLGRWLDARRGRLETLAASDEAGGAAPGGAMARATDLALELIGGEDR
ncbi:MAG: DNA repair exonuclease [Candidatus Sericytochromatia bacterium]|nr:DNA repair exonuclease [Candidatus Tanganyikabacteria bacterium]